MNDTATLRRKIKSLWKEIFLIQALVSKAKANLKKERLRLLKVPALVSKLTSLEQKLEKIRGAK